MTRKKILLFYLGFLFIFFVLISFAYNFFDTDEKLIDLVLNEKKNIEIQKNQKETERRIKDTEELLQTNLDELSQIPDNGAEARHILIAYPGAMRATDNLPYKNKNEAKTKATQILEDIKNGGDFIKMAKEFSTGPSATFGGDLGLFSPGTMTDSFDKAVFELEEPGIVDYVVETPFGYHIIEVLNFVESD